MWLNLITDSTEPAVTSPDRPSAHMLGEKVVLCGFLQAESPGGILLVRGAPLPRNVEDTEQSFVSKDVMTFREAVQFSYKFTFFVF